MFRPESNCRVTSIERYEWSFKRYNEAWKMLQSDGAACKALLVLGWIMNDDLVVLSLRVKESGRCLSAMIGH